MPEIILIFRFPCFSIRRGSPPCVIVDSTGAAYVFEEEYMLKSAKGSCQLFMICCFRPSDPIQEKSCI